jgi:hypothetical protein
MVSRLPTGAHPHQSGVRARTDVEAKVGVRAVRVVTVMLLVAVEAHTADRIGSDHGEWQAELGVQRSRHEPVVIGALGNALEHAFQPKPDRQRSRREADAAVDVEARAEPSAANIPNAAQA